MNRVCLLFYLMLAIWTTDCRPTEDTTMDQVNPLVDISTSSVNMTDQARLLETSNVLVDIMDQTDRQLGVGTGHVDTLNPKARPLEIGTGFSGTQGTLTTSPNTTKTADDLPQNFLTITEDEFERMLLIIRQTIIKELIRYILHSNANTMHRNMTETDESGSGEIDSEKTPSPNRKSLYRNVHFINELYLKLMRRNFPDGTVILRKTTTETDRSGSGETDSGKTSPPNQEISHEVVGSEEFETETILQVEDWPGSGENDIPASNKEEDVDLAGSDLTGLEISSKDPTEWSGSGETNVTTVFGEKPDLSLLFWLCHFQFPLSRDWSSSGETDWSSFGETDIGTSTNEENIIQTICREHGYRYPEGSGAEKAETEITTAYNTDIAANKFELVVNEGEGLKINSNLPNSAVGIVDHVLDKEENGLTTGKININLISKNK